MDGWGGIMRHWLENARILSNISSLNHRNAWIGGFAVTICKQIMKLQQLLAMYKKQVQREGERCKTQAHNFYLRCDQ